MINYARTTYETVKTTKFLQLVIGIVAAWILSLLFFFTIPSFGTIRPDSYAALGDSFGTFNALVSALAFAGVIYTIILQKHSLDTQTEDLQLQREEFKKSVVALEQQANIQATSAKLQALSTLLETYERARLIAEDSNKQTEIGERIQKVSSEIEQITDSLYFNNQIEENILFFNALQNILKDVNNNNLRGYDLSAMSDSEFQNRYGLPKRTYNIYREELISENVNTQLLDHFERYFGKHDSAKYMFHLNLTSELNRGKRY